MWPARPLSVRASGSHPGEALRSRRSSIQLGEPLLTSRLRLLLAQQPFRRLKELFRPLLKRRRRSMASFGSKTEYKSGRNVAHMKSTESASSMIAQVGRPDLKIVPSEVAKRAERSEN